MNKFKIKKQKERKKAIIKINELFSLAEQSFKKDKDKANMHVRKARRIAMKHNIKLGSVLKKRFCKHCYSYIVPGVNCRVRTRNKMVVYYCFECKRHMRFGIKRSA
ncbi:MAG: ribonuclease P [Nanoarchaeota archaeon]|nr:ribonuclease P [Nanoarchaeota archaeon]